MRSTMSPSTIQPRYRLRVRLSLLVGILIGLVLVTGAVAVATALAARRAITTAHQMEIASRRSALLSVIVREQYIHEAHTIILRDRSHVGHHDEWVEKLDAELDELAPDVDAAGREGIGAIHAASQELRRVFAQEILPAIDREDWALVRRSHDRANELVDRMTQRADEMAAYFDGRAVAAEQDADRLLQLAVLVSIALGALAAALALLFGRTLWRAFTTPLAELDRVARQVARGERGARVGALAAEELTAVAEAFDGMLDALARTEADLVDRERLAAIGRVAAGVAHEINNPIAVIRGYVKTMREEASDPALRDELAILDEEATSCQRIAEDLLVYAHAHAHAPATAPVPVPAGGLLREAAARVEAAASSRDGGDVAVVVEADETLISVDPLRMRQVVLNLVKNAREASVGGEPVIVRGRRNGDDYRIEVLDRGVGLPDEARGRIFEPFFSARSGGTGLGLAVCQGLVTAHGGTIRAEPREGGGSRFVVDLPAVVVEERTGR